MGHHRHPGSHQVGVELNQPTENNNKSNPPRGCDNPCGKKLQKTMQVKYNGELWNVDTNAGTENYYCARRVTPKYVDFDTTTCETVSNEHDEYIPKAECEIVAE